MDVCKAFDSVNHYVLIEKLYKIGFREKALELLKSYLTNRKQYVQIEDMPSSEMLIRPGVPQGSIIGPILFTIFVNDIFECKLNGSIQLYADDICLTYGEKTYDILKQKMKDDLTVLADWMTNNRSQINFHKTNFMIFYLRNTDVTEIFNEICIGNYKIERVSKSKYMGLTLNESLNWIEQVDETKKK